MVTGRDDEGWCKEHGLHSICGCKQRFREIPWVGVERHVWVFGCGHVP